MNGFSLKSGSEPVPDVDARRPDLFIIGAAKCGTTSLYEYLAGHPEIYMSPDKEPQYFAPDLATEVLGRTLHHPQDMQRYLGLFRAASGERRLGEASVRYIYSREAPTLLNEFQPDARIIAMVRDPVEMMRSLHAHYVAGGIEQITDFAEAVEAEEDRRGGRRARAGMHPSLLVYSARARFGEQLARWYEAFPREQIHVIVFEEFVAEPARHFRQLLEFLGVDPTYEPPSFAVHNPGHAPRFRSLLALESARPVRLVLRHLLPQAARDALRRRLVRPIRHLNRKAVQRAPMSGELRARLREELAPDVALLSELLGRDLAAVWWGAEEERRRLSRGEHVAAA